MVVVKDPPATPLKGRQSGELNNGLVVKLPAVARLPSTDGGFAHTGKRFDELTKRRYVVNEPKNGKRSSKKPTPLKKKARNATPTMRVPV